MSEHLSWGLYPQIHNQKYQDLANRLTKLPETTQPLLGRGLGRSYGDSCLNEGGLLIGSSKLNHFISFNSETGILCCESGVSFDEILQFSVPRGWFLPVTPGTKFVTVAGAIANDVHGKNHHKAGNFGHHVLSFELLRSSGERVLCSRQKNTDLFFATIGGLGLTGFITWVEFELKQIKSAFIEQEQIQFHSLQEFFDISLQSEHTHEFTVSWVDCVNSTDEIRGLFMRGNFRTEPCENNFKVHNSKTWKHIPCFFPEWVLNSTSIKAFNQLYFHKNLASQKANSTHYEPFFYPLDAISQWNKIYGARGFLQYQFVIPYKADSGTALREIFKLIQGSQMGSFLAVLKTFGSIKSEGMMSFPREGVTLALDFANYGSALFALLDECDKIVRSVHGSVYPAKDARMNKENFHAFYPQWNQFEKFMDPHFSSSFWRRVK